MKAATLTRHLTIALIAVTAGYIFLDGVEKRVRRHPLSTAVGTSGTKKIIHLGWDMPTLQTISQNLSAMEAMPFDGFVFDITIATKATDSISACRQGILADELSPDSLERASALYRSIPFNHLKSNFLRINVGSTSLNWLESQELVQRNMASIARLAQRAGIPGIFLDFETYKEKVFSQQTRLKSAALSEAQYTTRIKDFGRALIQAMQREYPTISIMLPVGYYFAATDPSYRYVGPLIDGLRESALPTVTIIDGSENTYGALGTPAFRRSRSIVAERAQLTQSPFAIRPIGMAFGIWLDYDSKRRGWSTTNLQGNYFSPQRFYQTVADAIVEAEEFVWIYNQQPRWWSNERLPSPYIAALKRARKATGLPLW